MPPNKGIQKPMLHKEKHTYGIQFEKINKLSKDLPLCQPTIQFTELEDSNSGKTFIFMQLKQIIQQ